ncbi:MAG: leucine-rich repeat domain-containing protein, partial [Bacteroidia bacterium]
MKQSFLLLFLLLGFSSLFAQAGDCTTCKDYLAFMQSGKQFLAATQYDLALPEFQAAQVAAKICKCEAEEPNRLIDSVFKGIKRQRDEAIQEKQRADSTLEIVQAEQAKNRKIIASFFFYKDRFGLAVKKYDNETIYGFIDKEGNERIPYKYSYAQPFDEKTGLALVKKGGVTYFLDTLQNEYRMSDAPTNDNKVLALDLREKNLETIPDEVFQMQQLKILLLGKNELASIPPQMKELRNLLYLDLSANTGISRLENLDNLTQLVWLDVSGEYNKRGNITKIEGLDSLKALQSLDISYNQLSKIEGLDNLNALQSLAISSNQLSKIEGLDNLKALQRLDISWNQLSKIEGLDNLKALQSLDIHSNKLSKIEGLDNLQSLQSLAIYHNQISKIEGLDNLKALQRLDI